MNLDDLHFSFISVCRIFIFLKYKAKQALWHNTPWRNIKNFRQLLFFKSFWHRKCIAVNGELIFLNDTTQFSEDMREIYIEKFTNIGISKLRWDISRFFNDVTYVNGFLLINAIIVQMTVHFLQWCVNSTDIH